MSARSRLSANNRAVIAGFAGLLILMASAEIEGIGALRHIQRTNDEIHNDFLQRTRLLERIRADVYISGSYVRDYLLEPEPEKAEGHRQLLLDTRRDLDAAVAQYRLNLSPESTQAFAALSKDLADYWKTLDPVFDWTQEQRQHAGYSFLRDQVFPRRTATLQIADRIGAMAQAHLRAGSQRVQDTYRQFRRLLTATIGLTMGFGIVLAAFSVRKILKLEKETADRRDELQRLSARLVEAQEQERRSISRELHDEVGQSLTGVLVEMANLSTLIRNRNLEALSPKSDEIKKLVENSIRVVRNMALLLRPSMLDDLGLVPALEWQAREVFKRSGVWVKLTEDGVSEDLPEELKTCVYRIVQEALHNCVQHSGAREVRVAIRQEQSRILLSIEDDGKGFRARQERGMGLLGMEERVAHLGGNFTIDSEPGRGTALHIVLPVKSIEARATA